MSIEVIGSVYLHIDNGGITIQIQNDSEFGPVIAIQSLHFGNNVNVQKIFTSKKGIIKLKELFDKAAETEFNKTYCNAAVPTSLPEQRLNKPITTSSD